MTQPGVWTQYSTIEPLLGQLPGWVSAEDKQRIAAYLKYDQIYWSGEEGFVNVLRGDNENPIMLPTARTLVKTLDRYTMPGLGFRVEGANTTDVQVAELAFTMLFRRELFYSTFNAFKLEGGKLGDALLHVVGDVTKPVGRRLRITKVDPALYFPVYDVDDPERMVRVHLAEQVTRDGKPFVSRMTYEKMFDDAGVVVGIQRSHGLFVLENWWDLTQPEEWILPPEMMDERITRIPVYHYKNGDPTAEFGSSDVRGLESVMAGLNQATSDEDLTLAMEGLGVWATDGQPPVDENGDEVEWIMGPGRVIANANGLRRLSGAGTVSPYQEHIDFLRREAQDSVGVSDIAVGRVQGTEGESGIALQLRLGAILWETGKKDQELTDLLAQLFYDLQFWLEVYEELPMLAPVEGVLQPRVTVLPTMRDKTPKNAVEVIQNVVALRNCVPPVISLQTSHVWLRDAGLVVPDDELDLLAQEAAAALDPLALPGGGDEMVDDARLEEELL